MSLKYFICPDGKTRPTSACNECPREEGRCLSLPTLRDLGNARVFKGTPSTTMLLSPTRLEYLKIKYDYAESPHGMAFALLGTRHHYRLEQVAKQIEGLVAEEKLKGEVSGIVDLLEPDDKFPDKYKLIDLKTWGSYAVAKILSQKEKGGYELRNAELQLNNYRIMCEALGFKISRMFAQVTVRDGGTFTAKNNKVDWKLGMIPIAILDDDFVKEYFNTKKKALMDALESDTMPELCPYEERWGGRRCKGFCPVFMFCLEGAKVNKVELKS